MPVGKVFGPLSVFDLLGNYIPGLVLLSSISLLLPERIVGNILHSSFMTVFVFGVIAFALGHLVQNHAAQAVGQRETFRNSIFLHQSLGTSPVLNFEKYPTVHPRLYCIYEDLHPYEPKDIDIAAGFDEESSEDQGEKEETDEVTPIGNQIPKSDGLITKVPCIPARFYRSLIEAIAMVRVKRDRPLPNRTLSGKVWRLCRRKYNLDATYDEYGDLLHLISSDIETQTESSRALRFQALRNFQRGMWIACYFSLLLTISIFLAQWDPPFLSSISQNALIEIPKPLILDLSVPIWVFILVYSLLMYLFWELKEDYEEEFIEYLLADFLSANAEFEESEEEESRQKITYLPNWYQ